MLIKTSGFNFKKLQQKTIEDVEKECLINFFQNLKGMYITEKDEVHVHNIKRYDYYRVTFSKLMTVNSENIVFERTINVYTVEKFCKSELNYPKQTTMFDFQENVNVEKRQKEFKERIFECFGKGEFPMLTIHIIKIGKIEYFYYTVSR